MTIDGKLQTLQRRWSDVKEKISSKVQVVEGEIGEWSDFTKELDERLTELRNADISLGAAIISTAELKVLEDQLAKVKVCFGRDVSLKLKFELYQGCCVSINATLSNLHLVTQNVHERQYKALNARVFLFILNIVLSPGSF